MSHVLPSVHGPPVWTPPKARSGHCNDPRDRRWGVTARDTQAPDPAPEGTALGRPLIITAARATHLLREVARARARRAGPDSAPSPGEREAMAEIRRALGWGGTRGLPIVVGATLMRHQVRALCWMRERELLPADETHGIRGGVLSLAPGLGKTLTMLAHVLVRERGPGAGPTLVVCSKTVLFEWRSQGVEKFFGAGAVRPVRALYLHASALPGGRRELVGVTPRDVARCDLVVTTYDVCREACRRWRFDEALRGRDDRGRPVVRTATTPARLAPEDRRGAALLYGVPWERVVLDESQTVANPETATYAAVMALCGRYKWCLTGTPVRNYATDLWAQMRFLGYDGVRTAAGWRERGDAVYEAHGLPRAVLPLGFDDCASAPAAVTGDAAVDAALAAEAAREAAFLRLPPRRERTHDVDPTPEQVHVHRRLLALARSTLAALDAGRVSFARLLAVLTRLRQAAIAPHLMMMGPADAERLATLANCGPAAPHPGTANDGDASLVTRMGRLSLGNRRRRGRATTSAESDRRIGGGMVDIYGSIAADHGEAHQGTKHGNGGADDDDDDDDDYSDNDDGECGGGVGGDVADGDKDDPGGDLDGRPPPIFDRVPDLRAWCADPCGTAGADSPKMRVLCAILAGMLPDEKALVFSTYRSGLLLAALAISRKRPFARPSGQGVGEGEGGRPYVIVIDGTIRGADRAALFDRFRSDPNARTLLMTYRVGAEGINLTAANHVVFLDFWWNHATHAQADARTYRLGQTRPVTVHELVTRGTIEPSILALCDDKDLMAQSYMDMSRDLVDNARRPVARSPSVGQRHPPALDIDALWRLISHAGDPRDARPLDGDPAAAGHSDGRTMLAPIPTGDNDGVWLRSPRRDRDAKKTGKKGGTAARASRGGRKDEKPGPQRVRVRLLDDADRAR